MRTFCEHFLCDGVHQGDTTGVWVLLESEPVLDSPYSPNALVMRRSGVRISEAAPRFWLVSRGYAYILRTCARGVLCGCGKELESFLLSMELLVPVQPSNKV